MNCSGMTVEEVWGCGADEDVAPWLLVDLSESRNLARLVLSLSEKYGKHISSRSLSKKHTAKNSQRPLSETLLDNVVELTPAERLEVQARLGLPLAKPFEKR